jgi:hypothetical protein
LSKTIRNQGPTVSYSRGGNCRISQREYWKDITGTVNFTASEGAAINAGNENVCPWLARIAQNFEFYKFHKFKICYEPECSTTTSGFVLLTVDYDTNDPPPLDKQQAMAYKGSVRAAPWTSCEYVCSQADLSRRKSYFTRPSQAGSELALYNVGRIFSCTGGNPAGVTLGEIYVEYEVELITPQQRTSATAIDGEVFSGTFESEEVPVNSDALFSGDYGNAWIGNMSELLTKVTEDKLKFKADYSGFLNLDYLVDGDHPMDYVLSGIQEAAKLKDVFSYNGVADNTVANSIWEIVAKKGEELLFTPSSTQILSALSMYIGAKSKSEL